MKTQPKGDITTGIDSFLASIEAAIETNGFAVVNTQTEGVGGDLLPVTYTVGLHTRGLPEIFLFATGMPHEEAYTIAAAAAQRLLAGDLPTDAPLIGIANLPLVAKAVLPEAADGIIVIANNRAGCQLPALQLVWLGHELTAGAVRQVSAQSAPMP